MELSVLDIAALAKELQSLVHARINKVYELKKGEFLFPVHSSSMGKQFLHVLPGQALFLAEAKAETPPAPSSFCQQLRKLLEGGIIQAVEQVKFERIICITIQREALYKIYVEFFAKGNLIVADNNDQIIAVLHKQEMRDRTLRPRVPYRLPPAREDMRTITAEQFIASVKEGIPIVKQLAIGLGGMLAEEICHRAKINKNAVLLSLKEKQALYTALQEVLHHPIAPHLLREDNHAVRVLPFRFRTYPEQEPIPSMSSGIAAVLAEEPKAAKKEDGAIKKLQNIIALQSQQAAAAETDAKEEQRKAELLYEQYQEVKEIVESLRKALKENRLSEEAKKYGRVLSVDARTGTATIELE